MLEEETRKGLFLAPGSNLGNTLSDAQPLRVGTHYLVYRAYDQTFGKTAIITELFPPGCVRSGDEVTNGLMSRPQYSALKRDFLLTAATYKKTAFPGLQRIFGTIEANNTVYLVIEEIIGKTLREMLPHQGPMDVPEAIAIVRQVASTVRSLHRAGCLHRNISADTVVVDAHARTHLCDFLPAVSHLEGPLRLRDALMGTNHMAPEQWAQKTIPGPGIDIYALGVMLYEMMTGLQPTGAVDRLLGVVVEDPASRNRAVSGALSTLIMAALKTHPKERLQSVDAFIAGLDGLPYPAPPPVAAVPETAEEVRFVRSREEAPEAVPSTGEEAIPGEGPCKILLKVGHLSWPDPVSPAEAIEPTSEAVVVGSAASDLHEKTFGNVSRNAMPERDPRPPLVPVKPRAIIDPELSGVAFLPGTFLVCGRRTGIMTIWDTSTLRPLVKWQGHSNVVRCVSTLGEDLLASCGDDRTVRFWRVPDGTPVLIEGKHASSVRWLATSPKGRWAASRSIDSTVMLWDTQDLKSRTLPKLRDVGPGLCFGAGGNMLFVGGANGSLNVYSGAELDVVQVIRYEGEQRKALFCLDDGSLLVVGKAELCRLTPEGRRIARAIVANDIAGSALSGDGRLLVVATGQRQIELWDAHRLQRLTQVSQHKHEILGLCLNGDGSELAVGSGDRSIWIFPVGSKSQQPTPRPVTPPISPPQQTGPVEPTTPPMLPTSAPPTGPVPEHEAAPVANPPAQNQEPQPHLELRGHDHAVVDVTVCGSLIATASWDHSARLWDTAGSLVRVFHESTNLLRTARFSANGAWLVAAGDDRTIRVYDTQGVKQTLVLTSHTRPVHRVVWLSNTNLATASEDRTVGIWSLDKPSRPLTLFRPHSCSILALDAGPGAKQIASGGEDGSVVLLDLVKNAIVRSFQAHKAAVLSLAFSPMGNFFATASRDKTAKVWQVAKEECLLQLTGHTGILHCVAYSPDGHLLATCARDSTVRIWDAQTGEELERFTQPEELFFTVCFSPNGTILHAGGRDGVVRSWKV